MTKLNMVPEFTTDEGVTQEHVEEGAQAPSEITPEPGDEEKETPPEPPAEIKPDAPKDVGDSLEKETLQKTVTSLQEERVKLLRDIADLRGQRREIKQEQLNRVEQQIDQLKDIHPEDVAVIEKVLRSKGYVKTEEAKQMFYESVKSEQLNKFLERYPEYKPENDSNDLNWSRLQKELGYYRMPDNPHLVGEILEKAHRAISVTNLKTERVSTKTKERQLEVARAGSGGTQRSSPSGKTLDPHKRLMLEQGGWSEAEIKKIEQNLT